MSLFEIFVVVFIFDVTIASPSETGIPPPASTLTFSFTFKILCEAMLICPLLLLPFA